TLEFYNGANDVNRWGRSPYQWMRLLPAGTDLSIDHEDDEAPIPDRIAGEDTWRQAVTLQPTGSPVLFAIGGPVSLKAGRRTLFKSSPYDQALQVQEVPQQPLGYEVVSNNNLPYKSYPQRVQRMWRMWQGMNSEWDRPTSAIDDKIRDYARRPEVSGVGPGNIPLVELRDRELAPVRARRQRLQAEVETRRAAVAQLIAKIDANPSPVVLEELNKQREAQAAQLLQTETDLAATWDGFFDVPTRYDGAIAAAIEIHLRTAFTYTLDLTDTKRIDGVDPMVAFLYDFKRGHCEYFAGAMTLMCQSLGIPARVVIGFRCDEYNSMGQYYAVNQSHAHAWVECRVPNTPASGVTEAHWVSFDPTSGTEASRARASGVFTRFRHFFDYLEHTWANNVIAYDRGSRDNLVQNLETKLTSTAVTGSAKLGGLHTWLNAENFQISSTLLSVLVALAFLALFGAIGWYAWERWKLWRRAERIGLDTLPTDERLRLARQLGFYDQLVQLLERRGHV